MMDIPPYPNSLIKGLTHYLFSFFHEAKLNSYYGFDLSDNLKWNEKPKNAIFKHGRWVPENPDGVTIGNLQSFAAIGVPELTAESVYEYYSGNSEYFPRVLPSKMTLLVGPEKDIEHLKVLFNNVKFQDFYIAYNQGDFKNRRFTSLLSLDHVKIDRLLYRVNKTSVVCSFHNLPSISVKCVDFAPIIDNPQDPNQRLHLPAICRLVVVSNTSNEVLSDLQFGPVFVNFGSEWEINELVSTEIPELTQYLLVKEVENMSFRCYGRYGKNFYVSEEGEDYQDAKYFESLEKIDKSEPLSEIGFCAAPFTIEALKPGESITLPYIFLLSQNDNDAETILKQIKAFSQQEPDISLFQRFLNQTLKYGSIEHDFAYITTSNPRLNDLVDSILSMMKIHIGSLGLHTGSVYYPHSSAFVRDNFMFQRALAKAGNLQAARLNVEFFYQSWRNKIGRASCRERV